MSAGFDDELKTTTGTLGFDRSKNQLPEIFGRLRSSRIRSGWNRPSASMNKA